MIMERKAELVPVADGGGLTVDSEVLRSWAIRDGHGHAVLDAEVDGHHLAVTLVSGKLRLSRVQGLALVEAVTRWQRYWDE